MTTSMRDDRYGARRNEWLESRMMGNYQVRFGGGRMEKGAAGHPSLPLHYGHTKPGTSRELASRLPTYLIEYDTVNTKGQSWSSARPVGPLFNRLTKRDVGGGEGC